jgi:glucokinase
MTMATTATTAALILAGDIGGTHSRLAILREDSGRLRLLQEKTYLSREHANLDGIVDLFLRESSVDAGILAKTSGGVTTACFGIAGPVLHGRVNASNLAWVIDARELSHRAGIERVWLINDLAAHASGVDDLEAGDMVTLNAGQAAEGNAALIAAGTGLGEAGMYWDGARRHAFASEGGHADFAPRNELEAALYTYLMKKYVHVSGERVLSGPGLKNIYDFLRDSARETEPAWLKDAMSVASDPAALISQHGLEGKAAICERALEIFAGAYGSEAGNLALRMLAVGGVFVSGGIAGKILPKLRQGDFLEAFIEKGRMRSLLAQIPIKVITNDRVGLIGAARYALTMQAEAAGAPAIR